MDDDLMSLAICAPMCMLLLPCWLLYLLPPILPGQLPFVHIYMYIYMGGGFHIPLTILMLVYILLSGRFEYSYVYIDVGCWGFSTVALMFYLIHYPFVMGDELHIPLIIFMWVHIWIMSLAFIVPMCKLLLAAVRSFSCSDWFIASLFICICVYMWMMILILLFYLILFAVVPFYAVHSLI